ncbi:cellulose 1,4-beta-cellobiosidase [Stackebrandtia albiflava]
MKAIARAAVGAAVGAAVLLVGTPAHAATGCTVDYQVNDWGGGFTAGITITNNDAALSGWELSFGFPGDQRVTNGWSADWNQQGDRVTAGDLGYNGSLGTGQSTTIGFNGTYSGTNDPPTDFTLNGVTCNDSGGGNLPPTVSLTQPSNGANFAAGQPIALAADASDPDGSVTSVDFYAGDTLLGSDTTSPYSLQWAAPGDGGHRLTAVAHDDSGDTTTSTPVSVTVGDGGGDPPGDRVDNPYVGADVYVNPDWSAKAAAEPGGDAIADQPTAVWMDRIAAIEGTSTARGLAAHLDTAVAQAAGGELVFQVVIYNLPGRDCAALASNGELEPHEIDRYKHEYIDPIADILSDPAYADLRIVTVIEIDSLPNLITNVTPRPTATPECDVMKANGNYVEGVGYALAQLGAVPNVYNYIDAGHHGWIGWDDNFGPSADLFHQAATSAGSTVDDVHGFIANTANYGALKEDHFAIGDTVNGTTVRQSDWIDWNRYVDELSFAQAFRLEAVSAGFNPDVGMLIDTSRNGWGGDARPTGPGPMTDVNAYVDGGRYDQRIHLGNWCNQSGAGLGERPQTAPEPGIDAYIWAKPPGESDGSSEEIPNPDGKGFDRMCDPTYPGNARNGFNMSGALPDAPLSGDWFPAQFAELLANAYPPL